MKALGLADAQRKHTKLPLMLCNEQNAPRMFRVIDALPAIIWSVIKTVMHD